MTDHAQEIAELTTIKLLKVLLPKWLKTGQAADVFCVTPNAMNKRIYSGHYLENKHYKKAKNGTITWARDALLSERENEFISKNSR